METRKDQKLKTRSKMETKEKNFEQDIESWLLTEGGYVYRGDRPHDIMDLLMHRTVTTRNSSPAPATPPESCRSVS